MSWFSRKNLRLALISFVIASITLNFIFFFLLGESSGGEYQEYHEINHHQLKRYFPRRNFDKSSQDIFGYYFGNIDRVTLNYTETPLPLNEKIDCEKHNERYVQVMKKMGIFVDIDERSQKYHLSQSDISYFEKWNKNVLEHMNNFYSQFCPFHQLRQKRRQNIKTEVEWKKNDTVIIYRGKRFRSMWVEDDFLNKYSDCENGLKYKVVTKKKKSQAHIRIYNLKDVLGMKSEIFDGGSIFDHYSVFFTLESPREDKHPESMFLKILENFDFILSYLPFSELPIYYDFDLPYLLRNDINVQKFYGYKEDRYKTYEELREETIQFISTVHKQGEEICTHISNCHSSHHHSYFEYRFFDGDGGMFRTNIIRNLNSDPDLNVINYGTCSYLGKKRTIQNLENIFFSPGEKMERKFRKQLETNLHPFHLSLENKMLDNYGTEKLFSGLLSKYSVPIYFGDPFIYQKFPEGFLEEYKVFIDVNDFVSPTSLKDYLKFLLRNQTAYLEYFEWRFQKVSVDSIIPKVVRPGAFEDFVDDGGKNVSPWCRITERFVKERMEYYHQESTQSNVQYIKKF